VNIEGKLRFIIFQQILDELESKRKKEPETSNFTRFFESGLLYLEKNEEKYNIQLLEDVKKKNETTDDFLLRMIKNLKKENINVYLATNDSELRKKAKDIKVNTIFLRQEKYLSIERA